MRYNVVYKDWQGALDDILPTKLESSGLDEQQLAAVSSAMFANMTAILESHPRAVPARIYSTGYGANIEVSPYWEGPEKLILERVRERIQTYGMGNILAVSDVEQVATVRPAAELGM